ncbi:uncharacterized protein FMAN_06859 [Fusarium mangiferae]|uniref:Apple domain-containing protein n=1 Tax=Fusarium mangiferae TaxID=192010 RepID=A0A1L7UHL6_FUSMA|nr:uncharacterized protein FMAN_06859 [Fusarium mangiferae]CVL08702.1 uncharacterized protein FMAN_06859 [Fusarium mangiferae]
MRSKAALCALWASLMPLCLAESCDQLDNPYQGPGDAQFDITCNAYSLGGNQIGPTIGVTDLSSCIDLCATTFGCKVALFDRSQYLCYTLDESDGPASNSLYDMAVLLPSAASSTAITSTTIPTTTSAVAAPTPCNQLDNPSYIDGVKFTIFCGKQATGGNQVDYSDQLRSLTECMTFCADTLACRAVTFDNSFNDCYLYDGFNGFMSDSNKDMAIATRPVASSTTEAPTEVSTTTSMAAASTTAPSGPLSCEQMAGSVYTGPNENKFTISCDTSSTGESIYRRDEEDSMQGCVDRCDRESRCIAVNFLPSPYYECDLIESFTGTKSSLSTNFASKIISSASTSASAETSSTLYTSSSTSISSGSPETTSSSSLPSALTSETTSAGTLESLSFTTTLVVTSEATASLSTTLSLSTSLSLSQDALSGTTSESALQSTLATTSATTSLAVISSSTALSASTLPDPSSSLSSESVSESTSDARLESTSASLEPTTVATSTVSLHTDSTSIKMSTTETLTKTSSAETSALETSGTTTLATMIQSTVTESSLSDTSRVSTEIQSTSDASASPSTSSTPTASNIPALGEYVFTGCLKSLEGYPSFKEVATDPKMTTRKCVELASGSKYIGVYQETCYKADLLDDTEFIMDASCDLPCPGDRTLFCGGILSSDQRLLHRAIAPNRLLTLYGKAASSPSGSTSSTSATSSASSLQTTGTQTDRTTSGSTSTSPYSQTDSYHSLSSFTTRSAGSKTLSTSHSIIAETTSETRLPTSLPTPTAIHTAYSTLTIGHAYTKSQFAETVTTVTYTTVDPSNPASLITTCVPITLLYSPCGCKHQVYPTVDMTTVACTHGGDVATLTVPKAAYETGSAIYTHPVVQYPSGWVGGHQTDAVGNGHPVIQPTAGSHGVSTGGKPESPSLSPGFGDSSHPSYKTYQPAAHTSVAGSNDGHQPGQGNQKPSVPADRSPESSTKTQPNPSKPTSPKSLTTETSILTTPQLYTSAIPSQSTPHRQGEAPSESKEAPHATAVVVSEAHRYDLTPWTAMTAIVGMILFF